MTVDSLVDILIPMKETLVVIGTYGIVDLS